MQMEIVYREKELGKLMQAYREFGEKGFRVHFITGEAGTGKTVLLRNFTEEAGRMDEEVIITGSSCPVVSAGCEEYQPFKDILQTILQEISETREVKQSRREKWRRVFGASASVLLKVAPDLIENFVPMGTLITAVGGKVLEETGVQQRMDALKAGRSVLPDLTKIADQYVEMLKMIARQYRLVFYIDNLQWIDGSSADLLHRMSSALRGLPVMFVGCYRSTDIRYLSGGERHPLEAFITHMKVDYREVVTNLDALPVGEKREFTNRLMDREPNRYSLFFRNEMFRRSGGNPLFVTELMSVLKTNGMLKQIDKGVWIDNNRSDWQVFPERMEGIIRERVAGLEKGQVTLLSAASVIGHCFLVQVLARMLEKTEEEILCCLSEELEKQRHLVEEGECFRIGLQLVSPFCFPDVFLREYLYRRLGGSQRMLLHACAARALEELYVGRLGEICCDLAYHYENSGEGEMAIGYLKMCVDKAVADADYGAAAVWARRGMCLSEKTKTGKQQIADRLFFGLKEIMALRIRAIAPLSERVELFCRIENLTEGTTDFFCCTELFWERWMICFSGDSLESALHLAETFILNRGKSEVAGYLAEGIACYWLGDFQRCKKSLAICYGLQEESGELLALCELYGALTAFHLAEYEEVDRMWRELSAWTEKSGQAYYCAISLLTKTWLTFLDEDIEQTEVCAGALWKLAGERGIGMYVHWAGLFRATISGRKEVWRGLELLKGIFTALLPGCGITLYGLMVCRLCFSKRLYDVFDRLWEEVTVIAEKQAERGYLGELLLLRGRCLEEQGQVQQAQFYLVAAKKEMVRSGEKRFGTE